jgi:hypothetical protein
LFDHLLEHFRGNNFLMFRFHPFAEYTETPDFDVGALMGMLNMSDFNWPPGGGMESK